MSLVPVEIQERLDALEARRLEIISENAVDRTAAEYAVQRIADRTAEKGRLKIEARALRMAVKAYAAQAVEVEDFGASESLELEDLIAAATFEREGIEIPDVAAGPEITEAEQPKGGAKEPVLREVEMLPEGAVEQQQYSASGDDRLAERVLRLLKETHGPLTRREIAQAIGRSVDRISPELSSMKRRGLVVPVEGQGWTVP